MNLIQFYLKWYVCCVYCTVTMTIRPSVCVFLYLTEPIEPFIRMKHTRIHTHTLSNSCFQNGNHDLRISIFTYVRLVFFSFCINIFLFNRWFKSFGVLFFVLKAMHKTYHDHHKLFSNCLIGFNSIYMLCTCIYILHVVFRSFHFSTHL